MKEIKLNDTTIQLKKDFITRAESTGIISYSIEQFNQESVIEGMSYDYIALENAFFDALCLICVENFDDDMREEIYNTGMRDTLLNNITNAKRTYDQLYFIAKEFSSISNVLSGGMKQLLSSMPDSASMENITKDLPALQEALDKYNHIVYGNKEGE